MFQIIGIVLLFALVFGSYIISGGKQNPQDGASIMPPSSICASLYLHRRN